MNSRNSNPFALIDWPVLRNALIVLAVSIVCAITLVIGQNHYAQQADTWAGQQQQQLEAVKLEFNQVEGARTIMDMHYHEDFLALDTQQFFYTGSKQLYNQYRLQLADAINAAIDTLLLPDNNINIVEFGKLKNYNITGITPPQRLNIYELPINLQLGIMHEGDLLQLISGLEQSALPGLLRWQACRLQRLRPFSTEDIQQANFQAACDLMWYIAEIQ